MTVSVPPAPAVGTGRRRRRLAPWAITVAATVVSAYALDAVATAAGLVLVASHALSGLGHWQTLVFLGATYVVWGAGLRTNLRANWSLLEQTGTSTNVLSKAAHDLTRMRTASVRARRFAAAAGYAGTELAKEAPYYAGAFGAAVLTDSFSSGDALVFLSGANLGAAGYEYGLARATRSVLRLRSRRAYASFDDDWAPAAYLREYYHRVEPDERETIAYFVEAIGRAEPGRPILFFGVGPTLHHVFLAAEVASEIHLADYLPGNLAEIDRWVARDPCAHDWRPFVRYTLQCEGVADPTPEDVARREDLTRAKITRLLHGDAGLSRPVASRYVTVVSAYCADSATADRATWETFMAHISGLVCPGGMFITSALRRCRWYVVGGRRFPSANVDEHDIRSALEPGFEQADASVETRHLPEHESLGYSGIVLASARRREPAPVVVSRPRAACGT